jgi:hypothetical protein
VNEARIDELAYVLYRQGKPTWRVRKHFIARRIDTAGDGSWYAEAEAVRERFRDNAREVVDAMETRYGYATGGERDGSTPVTSASSPD